MSCLARICSPVLVLAAGLLTATGPASAQAYNEMANEKNVIQGPIFNPATNSYFEVRLEWDAGEVSRWVDMNRRAVAKSYKGVRGRLGVVRDRDTLEFIQKNFKITHETWIGLRYFCKHRKMLWTTGEIEPIENRALSAPQWLRATEGSCQTTGVQFMPVYLKMFGGNLRWQATGDSKHFHSYLVEYPMPARDKSSAASAQPPQKSASSAEK